MEELTTGFIKSFAKQVMRSLRIGKKPNEKGIKKAKNRFSWAKKLVGEDRVDKNAIRRISGLKGEKLEKAIEELESPAYGPLLWKRGSAWKVKKEIGETVIIGLHPQYAELACAIADEARKRGAHAKIANRKADDFIRSYKYATHESCAELPEPFATQSAETDILISSTLDSSRWKKRVDVKKIKAGARASMILRARSNAYGQRWVLIGLPFKKVAREYQVPYSTFKRVVFESIKESFSPTLRKIVDYYTKELSNKRIRITADDGTDLTMKCRKMMRDMGCLDLQDPRDKGLNLPTGESFVAPVEGQTNGKIFFKRISPHGYGTIDDIWLEFKDGRLVKYKTSPKGMKIFKRLLDENTGNKLVAGELGIGCNRKARSCNGFIIVDEKIFGTIHVALGENVGYGGKNTSSLHFDMVKDMRTCNGRIWAGKKLVMDKGLPTGLRI
jgi:aminopeptidase